MALNFPGPGIAEIFYTCDGLQHKQTLSVNMAGTPTPGDAPQNYSLVQRNNITVDFDAWVEQWLGYLAPFYADHFATFDRADLWWSDQTSFDRIFLTTYSPTQAPSGSGQQVVADQQTMSFRTLGGGQMRVVTLEASGGISQNQRSGYPTGDAETDALMAYVISDASPLLGRDTTPPYSAISISRGQNEVLWRKRYR